MFVSGLDHFNIWTSEAKLDETRAFYCDIIGLTEGFRPQLTYPGVWLYCDKHPLVHVNIGDMTGAERTGMFDHVAFAGKGDADVLMQKFADKGIDCSSRIVGGGSMRQLFCSDPNGVKVEFNFSIA